MILRWASREEMMRSQVSIVILVALACAVGMSALSVSAQGGGDAARGQKIFNDSGEELDYPACASCHATVSKEEEANKTGHVRPAFPVYNTSHRGAWKNAKAGKGPKSSGDAGNICVRAFQKRKKLPADQVADLNAYLLTLSPSKDVKPRKIAYAPKLPGSLDGGDKAKGKAKVQLHCGGCHGDSDDHIQFTLKAGKRKKKTVAMKVRGWIRDKKAKSGMRFKANNGMMSFFAKDRVSDADLLDILAYLGKD